MNKSQLQNTGYLGVRIKLVFFITLISWSITQNCVAQEIYISAQHTTLNQVLYELIEKYQIEISFDDRKLSREEINLEKQFSSIDQALSVLLENTPYTISKEGDLYLVIKKKVPKLILSGWVRDSLSGECLPYAHIMINEHGFITDPNGYFSCELYKLQANIEVSYLGYYKVDTVVTPGIHTFLLMPSFHNLEEITIEGKEIEYSMELGEEAGKIRLNQKTARKLPGSGDDAVFNFLRLQPGILAAGEQSNDLIIWGGYEGHSKVMFDGFTLYGLKNFNDNISAVNPYMAKDMLVLKGGYGVSYGGKVGGIVDISGIEGNSNKPSINLNINNNTMNGMASVPLNAKSESALSIAFRRTYYNLYDPESITLPSNDRNRDNTVDITIIPDYLFGDFNLKYAGKTDNSFVYYLSYYQGRDKFAYNLNQERDVFNVYQEVQEKNLQRGASAYGSLNLSSSLRSDITLSYSSLESENTQIQELSRLLNDEAVLSRERSSTNLLNEAALLNKYYLNLVGPGISHHLQGGISLDINKIQLLSAENDTTQINSAGEDFRLGVYLEDKFTFGNNKISLKPGVRLDYPLMLRKAYFQPRFSLVYKANRRINSYFSWGIYNQFVTKTSLLDDYGNYQYFWAIANNSDVPVLSSMHYVTGLSYNHKTLTFSAEGYYKETFGLTRFLNNPRDRLVYVYSGKSKTFGGDFLVKGRWKGSEAWISYTYSQTLENFTYFPEDEYRFAPQDQRHEVKASLLLDLDPFFISSNYVYGSGFIFRTVPFIPGELERYPYKRLDVSVFYDLSVKDYKFEIGASILNVLNTENIKYSNFVRLPSDQQNYFDIHAEAVPFTPTLFLNIAF